MILGPFSARPPSVELIDQEPATRRQATVMKFNLTRRNARFQGETPTSICIACETSPRVLSRRPAGTTRCESSSKARWLACGRGSVGRASPCQGEGRGFESRRPLGTSGAGRQIGALVRWSGREARQRPAKPSTRVQIPSPPRSPLRSTSAEEGPVARPGRAIGAAVARFPDTEEVTGSIPVSPTVILVTGLAGNARPHKRFTRMWLSW